MVGMSGRLVCVTWIAGLVAACSEDPATGIEVVPGSVLRTTEGDVATAYLLLDGAPGREFYQPVVDPDVFESAAISVEDDLTVLRVTPGCAAVAPGSSRRIEELTIRAIEGDAAPFVISVDITANEGGVCAVEVVGWAGPCASRPEIVPPEITLDATSSLQPVCIEVIVKDRFPDLDVTFPDWASLEPLELRGGALLDLGLGTHTLELMAANVHEKFRGRRDLEVRWGVAGVARLPVVAGEPGQGQLRIRGGPEKFTEYQRALFPTGVSYFEKPGTVACVRAMPRSEDTELVVRVVLDDPDGSDSIVSVAKGALGCGGTINELQLVPGIRSDSTEIIDVELLACTLPAMGCETMSTNACCETATLSLLDSAEISRPTRSVAESLAFPSGSDRACIDLDDDEVPEIVVTDTTETRMYRATAPTDDNVRLDPPVSTSVVPTSMLALRWFDGLSAHPFLLGEFVNDLRIAIPTGWSSASFEPRPSASEPASRWVPLEPKRGDGASYLAVKQSGSVIGLVCISVGCNGDGVPIDVTSFQPGQETIISGYGVFDYLGDGDLDLVLALDTNPISFGLRSVTLFVVNLEWQGHELTRHDSPIEWATMPRLVAWNTLQFVALPRTTGGDALYVLTLGANTQNLLFEFAPPPGPLPFVGRIVGAIGGPREIADVGGTLFVATDLGVWELSATSWTQRDPERARGSTSSFPVLPVSGYGKGLRPCLMAPTAAASLVFDTDANARWTFADVTVEALPVP